MQIIAAGIGTVATGGAAAPLLIAGGAATIGSGVADTVECPTDSETLDDIALRLDNIQRDIKRIDEQVVKNGIQLSEIKENTMFNGLLSLGMGQYILDIKTTAQKYRTLERTRNGLLVKNESQKRWMNDVLGHGHGSIFAALSKLNEMVVSGTGISQWPK